MYGLSDWELAELRNILTRFSDDIVSAVLFGSRARGDFRETSDIDLAVVFRNNVKALLVAMFAESKLPYTVDIIDYVALDNNELKKQIEHDGRCIVKFDKKGAFVMTKDNLILKLNDYSKTVQRLKEALLKNPDEDDLYIDGTIQRFEFCYEMAWKLMKGWLSFEGIESNSPRSCIREGFKMGLITDGSAWLDMLEKRNLTSHTYNAVTAQEIYTEIKGKYASLFLQLEETLKDKLDNLEN